MHNYVWHIQLLGGISARCRDAEPIALTSQQTGSLFAFLALHPNCPHSREFLMALFWPDDGPEEARHSLRQSIYALRKQLNVQPGSAADPFITTRNSIEINAEIVTTDVLQFEQRLRAAAGSRDLADHIRNLKSALDLYAGYLLPGMYHEEFETDRRRLSELHRGGLNSLTLAYEMAGDLNRAIDTSQRLIELDPLVEEAHCDLMRLYAAAGKPSAVLRQYQELASALKRDLGEAPAATTTNLMELLRRDARCSASALGRNSTFEAVEFIKERSANGPELPEPEAIKSRRRVAWKRVYTAHILTVAVVLLVLYSYTSAHKKHNKPEIHRQISPPLDIVWATHYQPQPGDKSSEAVAVTRGSEDFVYVTGFVDTLDHDVDFLTLKLDKNGAVQWQARYNGPGNDVDRARDIAVDGAGNSYVTGESDNGKGNGTTRLAGLDIATIKYSPNGSQLWAKRYNGPDDGEDNPIKLLVDRSGVYVLGRSWGTGTNGRPGFEFVLIKYDPEGHKQWDFRYSAGGGDDEPAAMALDRDGSIYITGQSTLAPLSGPERDILTLKVSPTGKKIWERRYGAGNRADDAPQGMGLDNGGNIYVVGAGLGMRGTPDEHRSGTITIKYDSKGTMLWARGTVLESDRVENCRTARVTTNGEVAICGITPGESGIPTCRVVMRDANGLPRWCADIKSIAGGDGPSGLAVSSSGVLFCGGLRDNGGDPQFCAYSFDHNGTLAWKSYVAGKTPGGRATAITVDRYTIVVGQTNENGANHLHIVRYPQ